MGNLLCVVNVDVFTNDFTAAQFLDKLKCTQQSRLGVDGIDALFKSGGSVGALVYLLCSHADGNAVEARSLEYNVLCVLHDAGELAAHNACNGYRLLLVSDYQHFRAESYLGAVENRYLLSLLSVSDVYPAALYIAQVERMHRVAVFQHNKVCDINEIVDGTHAARFQPFSHPARGGSYLYVLYYRSHIA